MQQPDDAHHAGDQQHVCGPATPVHNRFAVPRKGMNNGKILAVSKILRRCRHAGAR